MAKKYSNPPSVASLSKPKSSARFDVKPSQKGLLKELEVGQNVSIRVRGKVVSVEMRVSEYGTYNCFTLEPLTEVEMADNSEYGELAEDD